MSNPLTKIRSLKQQTQDALKEADDANDAGAISELEELYHELKQIELRLKLNQWALSSAEISSLADRLARSTAEIDQKIDTFFADDLQAIASDLLEDAKQMKDMDSLPPAAVETDISQSKTQMPSNAAQYASKYSEMVLREDWLDRIDSAIGLVIKPEKTVRYRAVENMTGVPHWVVGVIHLLEASLDFSSHLHNGDPLSAPTVNVPKNRPSTWRPGITWAESAADALTSGGRDLDKISDWSIGAALEVFEKYNGLGYRNRGIMSPYLWSGSEYYDKGKYVEDKVFDPNATTKQIGAASILKRMEARDLISISSSKKSVSILPASVLGTPGLENIDVTPFNHASDEIDFPGKSANSTLGKGTKGMTTRRIQEWCSLHGIATAIDEDYGNATFKSVQRFQKKMNLGVTGEVDRTTWTMLTAPMRKALLPTGESLDWSTTLLKVARQHVAQNPTERGGPNSGPWVRLYMKGKQGKPQKWCAGFVCTLAAQAARDLGIKMPITRQVGVDALVSDAKKAGRFKSESDFSNPKFRSSQVLPGMMFVIRKTATDWNHVGLVTSASESTFNTIEGNTDGENNDGGQAKSSTRSYGKKDFLTFF